MLLLPHKDFSMSLQVQRCFVTFVSPPCKAHNGSGRCVNMIVVPLAGTVRVTLIESQPKLGENSCCEMSRSLLLP